MINKRGRDVDAVVDCNALAATTIRKRPQKQNKQHPFHPNQPFDPTEKVQTTTT